MTPSYKITANETDVTHRLQERLKSLVITDKAGEESDSVVISVHDIKYELALPATGDELQISLGYTSTGLIDMGLWVVDEIKISGPIPIMEISAKSANLASRDSRKKGLTNQLKASRTRSWDTVTLSDIVEKIAKESDYTPRIGAKFSDIEIVHIDQTHESNMHFLTRLARQYGAVAKPAAGFLLFVERGEGKSASGQTLSTISIVPEQVTQWSATLSDRGKYVSVSADYYDHDKAERIMVGVPDDEGTVKILPRTYPTKESAEEAIKARKKELDQNAEKAQVTLLGNPTIKAEAPISLSGFREGIDGDWIVDGVVHTLNNSGFNTKLDLIKGGT